METDNNGPGGEYLPCDWEGPEKRRCLLFLGHKLMKIGWEGHAPDSPVPTNKPKRTTDTYGLIVGH